MRSAVLSCSMRTAALQPTAYGKQSINADMGPAMLMLECPMWQVATPRVRTAVKADIPHIEDHVSKLHAVGAQTQQKLQVGRG